MSHLDFAAVLNALPYLFGTGMVFTLTLTAVSGAAGLGLGIILAVGRDSKSRPLAAAVASYVSLIQSTPLILMIFWFYFLVPYLGAWLTGSSRPIEVGAFRSAIITFTMFEAAYFCEIIRAGLRSVPAAQTSAGLALGLTRMQTFSSVVLPQVIRNMTPALLTRLITLFQDTSLVYVLSLTDFLGAASQIGQRDGRLTEMYLFVAIVYLAICFSASKFVKRLERPARRAR
jgi:glutamate/aspartate transport system permease protein